MKEVKKGTTTKVKVNEKVEVEKTRVFGIEASMLQLFWLPVLLVVAAAASLPILVAPKWQEIGDLGIKLEATKKKTEELRSKLEVLAAVDEESLKKDGDLLEMALPSGKDVYRLLKAIGGIGEKYGFLVDSFSVSPGVLSGSEKEVKGSEGEVSKVPFTVTFLGTKEKYVDFIMAIEKALPIFSIDSFDMKVKGETVELSLVVATYFSGKTKLVKPDSVALADLVLSKEEMSLIKRLEEFENLSTLEAGARTKKEYSKYQRSDPFSL